MAALCHDLGHLPFSHAAEKQLLPEGWNHELLSMEIICDKELKAIWDALKIQPKDVGKLAVGPEYYPGETFSNWEAILSEIITSDAFGAVPKIDDGPWPAFPADLTSIALVTAACCTGTILIHEKMFESRMYFTDKLVAMGANIILCDPHRAVVVGPSRLRGTVLESPDIRAGMALLIAALGAEGTSRIQNIRQIERGYERIDERLRALGASIERVETP